MNKNIKSVLHEIIVNHFESNKTNFHDCLIDDTDEDVGTGKYLLNQVNSDIEDHKQGINTFSNLKDLKLTKKAFEKHPNTYFVYSSGDSLGQPLTLKMANAINNGFELGSSFKLLPNEVSARKLLEKLA